ncbi:MAG: efflux RND transporter periplasmic adaptor subunit [Verrucomicrobiota bacterium]
MQLKLKVLGLASAQKDVLNKLKTYGGIGAALLLFCNACKQEAPPGPPPELVVTVAQPLKKSLMEWAEYTGRLDAADDVSVRARVSGYLESVHFEEGEYVKEGTLLFTIDQRPFKAEVNKAKASLAQAEASLSLAIANLERAQMLILENAISRQDFDLRQSEAEQAAANVQAAEAELETRELDLGFTKVKAPINGIAGERLATKGNLISGGSELATVLTTVVPHAPIYVYFEIDEATILSFVRRVMNGELPGRGSGEESPVELQLSDEEGFPHKGTMDFVDNRLSEESATITARGKFANEDRFLTPGLFARVRIPASREYEAILIPDSAVGSLQSKKYVWTVSEKNEAQRKIIELGPLYEGLRIVRSGLTGNETLITKGIQMVRPNAPLSVEKSQVEFPVDKK